MSIITVRWHHLRVEGTNMCQEVLCNAISSRREAKQKVTWNRYMSICVTLICYISVSYKLLPSLQFIRTLVKATLRAAIHYIYSMHITCCSKCSRPWPKGVFVLNSVHGHRWLCPWACRTVTLNRCIRAALFGRGEVAWRDQTIYWDHRAYRKWT